MVPPRSGFAPQAGQHAGPRSSGDPGGRPEPGRGVRWGRLVRAMGMAVAALAMAAGAAQAQVADEFAVVNCLLPPQMVAQGRDSVRFLPSKLVRLSAARCAAQGGARKGGLEEWIAQAEGGNVEAQATLGELYENGFGGAPRDLDRARAWYRKAAAAGHPRAASNLAALESDRGQAGALVMQSITANGVEERNIQVVATGRRQRSDPVPETVPAGMDLASFAFGNYHALLIGNADYQRLPKLKSPTHEVDALGELLQRRYGFKVTTLKNATQDQMLRQLDELDKRLKPEDNLLVYFSGHGAVSDSNEGFWIPVDGEPPTATGRQPTRLWVSSAQVREKLSVMLPRHVLVVADSCYSGRFLQFRGVFRPQSQTPSSAYLGMFGKLYGARSRTVLTSGGLTPVIEPNDGSGLSLFAKALLGFLGRNEQPVPSVQVYAAIQFDVMEATARIGFAQEPQWGPITGSGHESGDFWFRPLKSVRIAEGEPR